VKRILCIDHEGGHGGSSHSLFHLLSHMDQAEFKTNVICRKPSGILEKYSAFGIETNVEPGLPYFSPMELGWKQNLSLLKNYLPDLLRQYKKFDYLAGEIEANYDLVHFNHASLFVLASRLRRLTRVPFTMHIRARPENTILTRMQSRSILKSCNRLIYITENEQDNFKKLAGSAPGTILYNPCIVAKVPPSPHPDIPKDGRLKIASLKNFSPTLGHTRLIDIAKVLENLGAKNKVLFVLAGDMKLWSSLPGRMGRIGNEGGTLQDYVSELGLDSFFHFTGWVPEPDRVLAACDMLAAPSFGNNPWGRDIIESYSLERPVMATGNWNGFVKHAQTGLLADIFDPEKFAKDILRLADDRSALKKMGEVGRQNIVEVCSPVDRAHDLQNIWQSLISS
jgi:glycosyltransferase involved in cell wall biosynthesis